MEQPQLSWRARLAKSNINILNIEFEDEMHSSAVVYYEFMYHPYRGSTKWSKTFTEVRGQAIEQKTLPTCETQIILGYRPITFDDIGVKLSAEVLRLRKELEN